MGRLKRRAFKDISMAKCFLCGDEKETRKVLFGEARGFSDLCFDCVLKFYKIERED